MQEIEAFIKPIMRGEKKGLIASFIRFFLWVFSVCFSLVIFIRKWGYKTGFLETHFLPVPVISIGNIVAGGTGKTPFAIFIGKELQKECKISYLSRGYLSNAEKGTSPVIVSDGLNVLCKPIDCGDEPYLLAQKVPRSIVVAGKNRYLSGLSAISLGAEILLLDDGFQHVKLARDFDVVLVNAKDPFGFGALLPLGFLREKPYALNRCDLIVLTHLQNKNERVRIEKELEKYTKAPVIGMSHVFDELVDSSGENIDKRSLKGTKVALFCGIAHPQNFCETVEETGAQIVHKLFTRDHCLPDDLVLKKFCEDAKKLGAEYLLCTEKDHIKLIDKAQFEIPILTLKIAIEIFKEDLECWEEFLWEVKKACRLKNE